GGQRVGHRACYALVQVGFEGCGCETLAAGESRLISQSPKSGLENGQRYLTWQAGVGEAASHLPGLVAIRIRGTKYCQIVLRVLELSQETVLKDVGLLYVLGVPHVRGFVPHVAHFEGDVFRELALDTQAPVLNI